MSTLSPSARALMDLMWALTPSLSSQEEITRLLGEPAGTEEPLVGEWTWLYRPSDVPGSLLRVTFDTTAAPSNLMWAEASEMSLTYGELVVELGEPAVVYQVEGEEPAAYLAYPDRGFLAKVGSADPPSAEAVILLRREAARSPEELLEALGTLPGVQVLQAP